MRKISIVGDPRESPGSGHLEQMGRKAVETRCPECDKRLRLPDTYANQKIRCRNCSTIFRPVGVATNVDVETPQLPPNDVAPQQVIEPTPREPTAAPTRPASRTRSGGGGVGIALVVGIMLLTRIPQLFKDFGNKDRNKPVPAENRDENVQVLQDAFQEFDEQGEQIENELADPEIAKDQKDEVEDPQSDEETEFRF